MNEQIVKTIDPGDEYNEFTCITAGELRKIYNMEIPELIPDCGWIPRDSIARGLNDVKETDDPSMVNFEFNMTFTKPFKWFCGEYKLEEK